MLTAEKESSFSKFMGGKAYFYLELTLVVFTKLALCELCFEEWVEFCISQEEMGIFIVQN